MDWTQLLPLLGLGGIVGGIIGGYFQSHFAHQKQIKEYEHELKKKRYLTINILLLTKLDLERLLPDLERNRPHIQTETQLDQEINMEYLNSYIFASNDVISSLSTFVNKPHFGNYYTVANAMRKDLWGKSKDLKMDVYYAG